MSANEENDIIEKFKKFHDELTNIKYEDSIVGILDILGFKEAVKNEDEESLKKLQKSMAWEQFINNSINFEGLHFYMLSDTFIVYSDEITVASAKKVITVLENIRCGLFLEGGFLSRGCIVSGKHFFRNENLISPAFIKAHEIEKEAVYPRIIIEQKLVDLVKNKDNTEILFPDDIIEKDFDGYFVIRPFIQILEIAVFCDEETYDFYIRKNNGWAFEERLEDYKESFTIQLKQYKECLDKYRETIDQKNFHVLAKLNYLVNEYNKLIDLCKYYPEKEFLTSMMKKSDDVIF
ncbi:MAG: hypothetical protein J6K96_04035 [Treponema sp.]|nr:hypothetical protein [Treponema sp.]